MIAVIAAAVAPVANTITKFLESAGFEVVVARTAEQAISAIGTRPADVLLAYSSDSLDAEALCLSARQVQPPCALVLLYPPEDDDPEARAVKAGADGYLVGPLKKGTVVSCVRTVLRARDLQLTVERLEGDLRKHIAEPPKDLNRPQGTSADFEFFKKFLLMEVKRSRRYKYPVAFLLVAVDHFGERAASLSEKQRSEILTEALELITHAIRDIDLVVSSSEQRFLVFLPHTGAAGGRNVAQRLRERLQTLKGLPGPTASIGLAAYEPSSSPEDQTISFGTLMKEATAALLDAQAKGGDRIEGAGAARGRKSRISLG